MNIRITGVSGTATDARAVFVVTKARNGDPSSFSPSYPAPKVGDHSTLRLHGGVITDALTSGTYCDAAADNAGTCGA